jgi:hypothetical protein
MPIVTLSALLFGELSAGAVLTEQIFTIPGFGKLIVDAVFNRDYAVVQGVVLCHRGRLHPDEPDRRRPLRPAQPPAEAEPVSATAADAVPARAAGSRAWKKLRAQPQRAGRRGDRRLLRRRWRCSRRSADPRPGGDRLGRGAQGALGGALASAPTRSAATSSRG